MNDMLDSFADPHMRHAILVHLPIVAAMLAPALVIALAVARFKNRTLALGAIALLLLGSIGAALAANAGEAAESNLGRAGAGHSAPAEAALERHEELGEGGWMWPLIPAALLAMGLVPKKPAWRAAIGATAFVATIGVAGWIATTAHAGGDLVYRYGVGAPSPGLAAPPASPAPAGREGGSDHDD
jgi:uncharacterized membrane protein